MPATIKERTVSTLSKIIFKLSTKPKHVLEAHKLIDKLVQAKENVGEHDVVFLIHALQLVCKLDNKNLFKTKFRNTIILELTNVLLAASLNITITVSAIHMLLGSVPFGVCPSFLLALLLNCIQNNLQSRAAKGNDIDSNAIFEALYDIPKQLLSFTGVCEVTNRAINNSKQLISSTYMFFFHKPEPSSCPDQSSLKLE